MFSGPLPRYTTRTVLMIKPKIHYCIMCFIILGIFVISSAYPAYKLLSYQTSRILSNIPEYQPNTYLRLVFLRMPQQDVNPYVYDTEYSDACFDWWYNRQCIATIVKGDMTTDDGKAAADQAAYVIRHICEFTEYPGPEYQALLDHIYGCVDGKRTIPFIFIITIKNADRVEQRIVTS